MLEKYESFSTREKEEFRDICNELLDEILNYLKNILCFQVGF